MFDLIEKNLINFEKPARYIGNELGIPEKDFKKSNVRFIISYPDIYEVGMSNLGIKIIYDIINRLDFASCERVFSPWVDLEKFLREKKIDLFSLESKSPVKDFDFFGISIQYELLFSNFLNLLDLSDINPLSGKRNEDDPIIIIGGPAVINPHPYDHFTDLVLIGEAEEILQPFLKKFNELKGKMTKNEIIKELSEIEGIYSPKYSKNSINRQIYGGFNKSIGLINHLIPNIEVIQDKLVVEIMRGCPNKCRFCEAGLIYKPHREKDINLIFDEIEYGIKKTGLNEVTFFSLSAGDYSMIMKLTDEFINIYSDKNISFSLPSLKVESFNIDLLNKISSVRKSGLTFAIETGNKKGHLIINKKININKITAIIKSAIKNGWRMIKLYFMVGLPFIDNEKNDIIKFVDKLLLIDRKLKINLNIAVFVPKPHTVFQYEKQLSLDESISIMHEIENYYRKSRVTIKKHSPYASFIEGLIARGDEKIGDAVYEAFKKGCKFDGWSEFFKFDIYDECFKNQNIVYADYLDKKDYNKKLVWNDIDVGVTDKYYKNELEKIKKMKFDNNCNKQCDKECRICNKNIKKKLSQKLRKKHKKEKIKNQTKTRYLAEFSKTENLKYIGHIDIIKYFEKLFLRSDIKVSYTQGYNPRPKFKFSQAIPLGIESECELLEFFTDIHYDTQILFGSLRKNQHRNIELKRIKDITLNVNKSLFNDVRVTEYLLSFDETDYLNVLNIFNDYNKNGLKYSVNKKNKILNGNFENFIKLIEINKEKNYIKLSFLTLNNIPNIIISVKEIFKNITIDIKKLNIFNEKNQDYFESI